MRLRGRQSRAAAGRACRGERRRHATRWSSRAPSRLDRLGHGMAAGRLEIYGDVGAYLGQGMNGGRIELFGSAGRLCRRRDARRHVHVTRRCRRFPGSALPGDRFGMAEGTVLVGGDAGDRVGDRMRRGLIAVHGRLGDYAASRMIGGTIVAWPAAAPTPATPCAAARCCSTAPPTLLRHLRRQRHAPAASPPRLPATAAASAAA